MYENGNIESEVELSDDGKEEMYEHLAKHDLCQDLKLRDVKILARVFCIVGNQGKDVVFEVIFENDELAATYDISSAGE